jgi:3-oxoacyl-[acyl-carrier protein] reductase
MNFAAQKILITGGSSGIGKATARKLLEMGADVLITGPREDRVKATAEKLGCRWIDADVSRQADVDRTFQWVADNWDNQLDVVINNAGVGEFAPIEQAPMESYHRVFGVNFFGPVMMSKKAISLFRERGKGCILNIGASSALKGFANGSMYASSKFALRGFTECLREEVRKYNIRVFFVNPSEVSTALGNPERLERARVPSKLNPDHLAGAILYLLAMPEDAFIPEISVWATNPLY